MADQPAVAAAPAAAPAQQQPQGESFLGKMMRFFSYWMMIQMFMSFVFPKAPAGNNNINDQHLTTDDNTISIGDDSSSIVLDENSNQQQQQPKQQSAQELINNALGISNEMNIRNAKKIASLGKSMVPHWRENQFGRLTYYLVENNANHDALRNVTLRNDKNSTIKLHTFKIKHSDDDVEQSINVTIPSLAACAKKNCTLYLHALLEPTGKRAAASYIDSKNPREKRMEEAFLGTEIATACIPFVRFKTYKKSKLVRLFGDVGGGSTSSGEQGEEGDGAETEMKQEEGSKIEETSTKDSFEKSFMTSKEIEQKEKLDLLEQENLLENTNNNDNSSTFIVATIPPSVTVNVVGMWNKWEAANIPPQALPYFNAVPGNKAQYLPVLYPNEFWILSEHRRIFNMSNASTYENVNLTLSTYPLSQIKFFMYVSIEYQTESQKAWGLQSDSGYDDIKRMLIETEPWLLAITVVVSLLHTLFEYLTFSNDVAFWRGKKNFRGLSLRTVALNCYFQTVIFLYLFDGNETSYTVLIPSGIGVLIEYWKLKKTFTIVPIEEVEEQKEEQKEGSDNVEDNNENKNKEKAPKWQFWKHYTIKTDATYDESTRTFDEQAMRYLFYILTPCLIGYSIYSAVYDEHKGWYSFLIRTQVRFIYWTGFIQMTPQIFINYKKKSVGSLPWRAFIYKALNTFIDDLFAFVIKMPTMHRLAVFRDDLVFIILLYQRWIYPVDKTRSEMEGVEAEEEEKVVEDEQSKKTIEEKENTKKEQGEEEEEEAEKINKEDKKEDKKVEELD